MVTPKPVLISSFLGLLLAWAPAHAETFFDVDIGIVYSDVEASEPSPLDGDFKDPEIGYHFAIGVYRNNDASPWIYGVKFEAQDVVGESLLAWPELR